MNSKLRLIVLQEIAKIQIYPFKKSEKKIAKDIADEYGVKLHFTGTEKLDKIIKDTLLSSVKSDELMPTDEEFEHFKSNVYDELRLFGAIKD